MSPKKLSGYLRRVKFYDIFGLSSLFAGIVDVQREFTCFTAVHMDLRLPYVDQLMVQIGRFRNQSVAHNRLVTQGDEL